MYEISQASIFYLYQAFQEHTVGNHHKDLFRHRQGLQIDILAPRRTIDEKTRALVPRILIKHQLAPLHIRQRLPNRSSVSDLGRIRIVAQ